MPYFSLPKRFPTTKQLYFTIFVVHFTTITSPRQQLYPMPLIFVVFCLSASFSQQQISALLSVFVVSVLYIRFQIQQTKPLFLFLVVMVLTNHKNVQQFSCFFLFLWSENKSSRQTSDRFLFAILQCHSRHSPNNSSHTNCSNSRKNSKVKNIPHKKALQHMLKGPSQYLLFFFQRRGSRPFPIKD